MKNPDPPVSSPTVSSTPAADPTPRPGYTEHRAPPSAANPAAKSAENTANSKAKKAPPPAAKNQQKEIGGPQGPEPTRYGDWERDGRCVDF